MTTIEKKSLNFLLIFTTFCIFAINALAQTSHTFSGRATGVNANVSVLGAVSVNTTIAQTDNLPATGGTGGGLTKQVLSGNVSFGLLSSSNNLNTGVINTMTSGGSAAGTPDSSQSESSVNALNSLLLGNTITADVVRANTQCSGTNGTPSCTGNTVITNLRINGTLINVNTTTSVSLLGGVGTVFINEQTVSSTGQTRNITVNALRISLSSVNLLVADIIISQSQSGITAAAGSNICTPITTVTEGDLFAGGIVSYGVTSDSGSVTIDHVNAGTGLQSLTVVGTPVNAVVNIPAYTPGTYNPVVVTFTPIDPNLGVDFTLRAASTFHAANVRARCLAPTPSPTATPTPTAMPTPTPTATPTPTPINICTPITTVTEGDLFAGGIVSFGITSASGLVTVDHVNAGTGLQSLTVIGSVNATVVISPFSLGVYDPVNVTFLPLDPNLSVDFTLRAASTFHAANIRVRCGTPTPTPTATPTPTPTGTPTPTPIPGITSFSGRATSITIDSLVAAVTLNDTGNLPSNGGFINRTLLTGSLLGGTLTTSNLDATTQAAFDQSRSQAIVQNLTFLINGEVITASLIPVSTQCTCPAANTPPDCAGGVMIDNLRLNGTFIPITLVPNQTVQMPNGGQLIINEQVRTASGNGGTLTINGVHVSIPGISDVIFSRSESGIFCGSNVSADPGDVERASNIKRR